MAVNTEKYLTLKQDLTHENVTLVAVSKFKTAADILELYNLGQRDFGENYVQELVDKWEDLPKDIRWHFIGHLQTNKVKYIVPFVHLIHGVDSFKLLKAINKEAEKSNKVIKVLLQIHIAQEETKFGLDEQELNELMVAVAHNPLQNCRIKGLMGMASFTEDKIKQQQEFGFLKSLFKKPTQVASLNNEFEILSMGMSDDYLLAIEQGSNMIRIGSLLFGRRS